jgi:hypothetical protein
VVVAALSVGTEDVVGQAGQRSGGTASRGPSFGALLLCPFHDYYVTPRGDDRTS